MLSLSLLATSITKQSAENSFAVIEKKENFIGSIDIGAIKNLPVGVKRTINNVEYMVAVSKLVYYSSYTEMTMLMRITVPYADGKENCLYLAAENVKILENGSFAQDVKLKLLDNYHLKLGNAGQLILKGGNSENPAEITYAIADCHGFKELSIAGKIEFSDKIIIPIDTQQKNVSADFSVVAANFDDILVEIDMPDFEIVGFKNWRFSARNAVFDFSEVKHSKKVVLPDSYKKNYDLSTVNIWKGLYLKDVSVTLPPMFEQQNNSGRFSLQAQNMIIDHNGFSGNINAFNVIPLEKGLTGSWNFSLDSISFIFERNLCVDNKFKGKIIIPVDTIPLEYIGTIGKNEDYQLNVLLKKEINFSLLGRAVADIAGDSYVKLIVNNGKFEAEASLNGKLKLLLAKDNLNIANIPEIGFRNLKIRNKAPYFEINQLSYEKEIKILNFPATIDYFGINSAEKDKIQLSIAASIAFTPAAEGGIRGKAAFDLSTEKIAQDISFYWKIKDLKLHSVAINYSTTAFSVQGALDIFRDNKDYGNGYAGSVKMTINPVKINLEASAMFGKINTFSYWYCDAQASFGKNGLPIYPGLVLNTFGGGAYQHMKIVPGAKADQQIAGLRYASVKYMPDSSTSLGIKAVAGIASQANKDIFNGCLSLEMAFNNNNGMKYLRFEGAATLLNPIPNDYIEKHTAQLAYLGNVNSAVIYEQQRTALAKSSQFTANAVITMDFENDQLSGMLKTYLNAGLLKGSGTNNSTGTAEFFLTKEKWYIHAGTPDNRMGVLLKIGALSLQTGVYFMSGDNIPELPPVPQKMRTLFPDMVYNTLKAQKPNPEILKTGKGMAFGADFSAQTGDLSFLIFYANFAAGMGFDITLAKYDNPSCNGATNMIGINGWFAQGQAYAYLTGKMGLQVKVFGKKRKLEFFNASAALLMQTQLPNPFWFSGKVNAGYNLLGGLVKGNCSFKVELGEYCDVIEKEKTIELDKIIADVIPQEGYKNVDVLASPAVSFNMPVKETFFEEDGKNILPMLDKFEITSQNKVIPAAIKWNAKKTAVRIEPQQMLPENSDIRLTVQLSFKEKNKEEWLPLKDENGNNYIEKKEFIFTTGAAPMTINAANIALMYPVSEQQNYFIGETSKGFITLKSPQDNIFKHLVNIRFIAKNDTLTMPVAYNQTTRKISWTTPALKTATNYTVELYTAVQGENSISEKETFTKTFEMGENQMEQYKTSLSGTASTTTDIIIFSYNFHTSNYEKLSEKLTALTLTECIRTPEFTYIASNAKMITNVHYLQAKMNVLEPFDKIELEGNAFTGGEPLIRAEAGLKNNNYFVHTIEPLIYKDYPYNGYVDLKRNLPQTIIPHWAIFRNVFYNNTSENTFFPWVYKCPLFFYNDMENIQYQLAKAKVKGEDISAYNNLMLQNFPIMPSGFYDIELTYSPPGGLGTGKKYLIQFQNMDNNSK